MRVFDYHIYELSDSAYVHVKKNDSGGFDFSLIVYAEGKKFTSEIISEDFKKFVLEQIFN